MERDPVQMDGENRKKERGSFLPPFLYFLMAVFVLTSGVLGFVLGRNASRGSGELIDTIVLSPGEEALSQSGDTITHFLSGKVVYEDGKPCVGATVRMRDGEQNDETDAHGKFLFSGVRSGNAVLEVADSEGVLLASTPVELNFTNSGNVSADVTVSGVPSFEMPSDTRMVELTLTVKETGITIDTDSACMVTTQGDIVSFSSRMMRLESDTYAVMPGGSLLSSEGYLAIPSEEMVITPQGTMTQESKEEIRVPGMVVRPDGSAQTEGGVTVLPDSTVIDSGDNSTKSDTGVIIVEGDQVKDIVEELPDEYQPPSEEPQPMAPEETTAPESMPEPTAPPQGNGGGDKNGIAAPAPSADASGSESEEPAESVEPEETPSPTPEASQELPQETTPAPTPEDKFQILDSDTGISWSQQSMVDLFKSRDGSGQLKSIQEGGETVQVPLIQPGSSGYYPFVLKNENDFGIDFKIIVSEKSFHLPMYFSVSNRQTNYLYVDQQRLEGETGVTTTTIQIAPHSEEEFLLNWEWKYQDEIDPEEANSLDTAAGLSGDRVYIVGVRINAVQRLAEPGGNDDDTRYPGKRPYTK